MSKVDVLYPIIETKFKVCESPISWRGRDFWKAFESGNWEYESLRYVIENVKQGDIVLDVGAWIGPYTLLFSALKAITCAFEPEPEARHLLVENIKQNRLENIVVSDLAMGDYVGIAKLYQRYYWSDTMSSIVSHADAGGAYTEVNMTTIDDYCEQNNLKPALIKIDVEGYEAAVMNGARKTIGKYKPVILLEFHPHLMPPEQRDSNWDAVTKDTKSVNQLCTNLNTFIVEMRY